MAHGVEEGVQDSSCASSSATASDREGDGIPRQGGCFAGGLDCWHIGGAPRGNSVVGFFSGGAVLRRF